MRPLLTIAILCAALALAAPASASPNAYVAQGGFGPGANQHALAVFDVATGAKVGSIDLPSPALDVAIDPTGARAYVTTQAGLSVVDLATNSVVTSISGVFGTDVAVDPSGRRVYLTDDVNKITVVDTATNAVTGSITVGQQPRAVVVNTDGTHAYTGNTKTGGPYSISVVDLTTNMQTTEVMSPNLSRPENIGILPSGSKVYAANFGPSAGGTTVGVLDVASNTVASVTVGKTPTAAVANPAGTKVYVANRDSMSISVIDVATATVTSTFSLPFSPTEIAITSDGTRAALSSADEKVAFMDLGSGQLYAGPTDLPRSSGVAIPPTQTPVPAFSLSSGVSGEPVSFDASASTGGPVARYDWEFGDGATAPNSGRRVSHTYAEAGDYQVKLTETNTCDPTAFFGSLNVVFPGHTAYCRGERTGTKTVPVTIPEVAIGVVRTNKAKVGKSGVASLQVACIKELDCAGTLSLRTASKVKVGKRPRARVTLGAKRFKTIGAGHRRTIKLKLSKTGLRVVRAHATLTAIATVSVTNPSGPARVRAHNVVLKRG